MAHQQCPFHQSCTLHLRIGMTAAMRVWESFYCHGAFARCERYKLRSCDRTVPERLLPNGRLLEEQEGIPSRNDQAA